MKKETFIINVHSFIDVITNSSTELFMLDTDKSLEMVTELVKDKEKEFPPDYGFYVSINYAEDYHINEIFGYLDENEAKDYLIAKGYTVIPPTENINKKYICITADRGGMHPKLNDFIRDTFNVVYYGNEF